MADNFSSNAKSIDSPATKAAVVTPNDGADLASVSRAIYIGAGGNLAVMLADDSVAVTLVGVSAGSVLPLRVKRVMSTGTTATNIVALS